MVRNVTNYWKAFFKKNQQPTVIRTQAKANSLTRNSFQKKIAWPVYQIINL